MGTTAVSKYDFIGTDRLHLVLEFFTGWVPGERPPVRKQELISLHLQKRGSNESAARPEFWAYAAVRKVAGPKWSGGLRTQVRHARVTVSLCEPTLPQEREEELCRKGICFAALQLSRRRAMQQCARQSGNKSGNYFVHAPYRFAMMRIRCRRARSNSCRMRSSTASAPAKSCSLPIRSRVLHGSRMWLTPRKSMLDCR